MVISRNDFFYNKENYFQSSIEELWTSKSWGEVLKVGVFSLPAKFLWEYIFMASNQNTPPLPTSPHLIKEILYMPIERFASYLEKILYKMAIC